MYSPRLSVILSTCVLLNWFINKHVINKKTWVRGAWWLKKKSLVLRGAHRTSINKSRDPVSQQSFYPSRSSPSRWISLEELFLAVTSDLPRVVLCIFLRGMTCEMSCLAQLYLTWLFLPRPFRRSLYHALCWPATEVAHLTIRISVESSQ